MRTYEMGGLQLNCNNVDTLDGVGKAKLAGGGLCQVATRS